MTARVAGAGISARGDTKMSLAKLYKLDSTSIGAYVSRLYGLGASPRRLILETYLGEPEMADLREEI